MDRRLRRHRDHRVLAQQRDERRRCRPAPTRRRSGAAARARPPRPGATARRASSASIVARARCSALLTAATVVSSRSAASAAAPAEHVAQDQDRALAAGQPLDRGQERELHALALRRSARRGRRSARPRPRGARRDRARPTGSARRGRRSSSSRQALVAIRYSQVSTEERPLEAVERAPGAQQRLLRDVLGVVDGAEHPVAVDLERAAVGLDERAEGALVARLGGGDVQGRVIMAVRPAARAANSSVSLRGVARGPTTHDHAPSSRRWVLGLAAVASFMVALDTLVVSTALTTIRADLGASVEQLEWTVNAYNLSFAVLLMTASALGDRFGRRRLFAAGLALFALASRGLRARADRGLADRRPHRPGRGRGVRHAARARARRAPRSPPSAAASAMGALQGLTGPGGRERAGHRRRDRRRASPGSGSSGSTSRSGCSPSRSCWRGSPRAAAATARSTCPAWRSSRGAALGVVWGLVRGNERRLGQRRGRRIASPPGSCCSARSSRWEARGAGADAAARRCSARARSRPATARSS